MIGEKSLKKTVKILLLLLLFSETPIKTLNEESELRLRRDPTTLTLP